MKMNLIVMVKGSANSPQRFWKYIIIDEKHIDHYKEEGYVKSNKSITYDELVKIAKEYQTDLKSFRNFEMNENISGLISDEIWSDAAKKEKTL